MKENYNNYERYDKKETNNMNEIKYGLFLEDRENVRSSETSKTTGYVTICNNTLFGNKMYINIKE